MMPPRAIFVAVAATLLSAQALAADLPYLSQRLENPRFRATFTALLRGERNLPRWVERYLKSRNGVDTPGRSLAHGHYELYAVCEPHNCGGNFLYTLFLPGGGKAWALLTRDGGNYRFFGAPGPDERALLTAAGRQ